MHPAPLAGGPAHRSTLASAAVSLAVDPSGEVHAVTRAGAIEHAHGAASIVEQLHGARTALQVDPDRWLVARDDGAIVLLPLTAPPLDGLAAAVAAATHYRLR